MLSLANYRFAVEPEDYGNFVGNTVVVGGSLTFGVINRPRASTALVHYDSYWKNMPAILDYRATPGGVLAVSTGGLRNSESVGLH